jgi:hypothetical protein
MNPSPPPPDPLNRHDRLAGISRFMVMSKRSGNSGGWFPSASAPGIDAWFAAVFPKKKNNNNNTMMFPSDCYNGIFPFASKYSSLCEGLASPLPPREQQVSQQQQQLQQQNTAEFRRKLGGEEPPCSTCRYTGMAVCAGLSLHFLRLATEDTKTTTMTTKAKAMAKNASKKSHKAFFYGGALVWAAAGVYRSMLD